MAYLGTSLSVYVGSAPQLIVSATIQDGSITEAKLAANSVTTSKIAEANVIAADLATDSVTTGKIADFAVTASKLSNTAVAGKSVVFSLLFS